MSPDMKAARTETTFGQRVRSLRLKRGIRQTDLAATAGISWRHLIRIEQDAGGATKDSTVARLAEALDVDVAELRGDDDAEPRRVPLTPKDWEMLGELMARVGPSLAREEASS